jgi:hypothetical protein
LTSPRRKTCLATTSPDAPCAAVRPRAPCQGRVHPSLGSQSAARAWGRTAPRTKLRGVAVQRMRGGATPRVAGCYSRVMRLTREARIFLQRG